MTRFTSLLTGVERKEVETALPFTDQGFFDNVDARTLPADNKHTTATRIPGTNTFSLSSNVSSTGRVRGERIGALPGDDGGGRGLGVKKQRRVTRRKTIEEPSIIARRKTIEEPRIIAHRKTIEEPSIIARKKTIEEPSIIAHRKTIEEPRIIAPPRPSRHPPPPPPYPPPDELVYDEEYAVACSNSATKAKASFSKDKLRLIKGRRRRTKASKP